MYDFVTHNTLSTYKNTHIPRDAKHQNAVGNAT